MKKRKVVSTPVIPSYADKKQRARLIAIQQKMIRKHMSENYFVYATDQKSVLPFSKYNLQERGIDQAAADLINKTEIKWSITLCVLMREKNGKNKIIMEPYLIKTPCLHSEIQGLVTEIHKDMILELCESRWADNIILPAWIASSGENEIDEISAMTIFEKMGCYDNNKAQWEVNQ